MAQPLGVSPFQTLPVQEKLPPESQLSDRLSANSVVERRETASFYPNTSDAIVVSNAGGSSQRVVNIRMSSPAYVDLQTACLHFEHKLDGTAGGGEALGVPDNHILSLIEEARLLIGSQQVEHIRDLGTATNVMLRATETEGYHSHSGSAEGQWLYGRYSEGQGNAAYGGDDSVTTKIAARADANQLQSPYNTAASVAGANGSGGSEATDVGYKTTQNNSVCYKIPLAQIFGTFSLSQFFPLRNCGSITIQLRFNDDLNRVLVCAQQNNGGVPADSNLPTTTSTVQNMRVSTDIVYPNASYVSAVDQLLSQSPTGVMFGIPTIETQDVDFNGSASVSKKDLVFTLGTRYLKGMYVVFRSKADQSNPNRLSLSAFPNFQTERFRLFLNGVSYPIQPVEGAAESLFELEKAMNMNADVDRSALIPILHYQSDVSRSGEPTASAVDYVGSHIIGLNLDQVLTAPPSFLGGLSTLSGGYNIRLEVENSGQRTPQGIAGAVTQSVATALFYKINILQIRQNAVEVSSG